MQSLDRGLTVIRALGGEQPERTLTEVAVATGLTRAAARRFLHTLVELGYVRQEGGRFSLRPRVLELGYAYLSGLSLPEIAQGHMEDLANAVDESCSISILDGTDIVYIARVPTRRIMSVTIAVGTRFPAYATSMGRVLLASLPADERDRRLAESERRPLTRRTAVDLDELREILAGVAKRGSAVVDQELEDGLRSAAVPIRDGSGQTVAAMNVSVHASRTDLRELRRDIVPQLQAAAAAIDADLRSAGVHIRAAH